MKKITKELLIAGLEIRTSNDAGQAEVEIPKLWGEFMQANLPEKLNNMVDATMYAVYTEYEGDHTKPYTMLLGFQVASNENIPEGLSVKSIATGTYKTYTAKGDLTKDAVVKVWDEIWKSDIDRAYNTDVEVYGEKAIDPTNGEAEIWIGVK